VLKGLRLVIRFCMKELFKRVIGYHSQVPYPMNVFGKKYGMVLIRATYSEVI